MKTTNIIYRREIRLILIVLCVFISITIHAQTKHQLLRSGDASYSAGEYSKAEEAYRKAIEKEGKSQAKYNLGNSLYEQERYDEALEQYQSAINSAPNNESKSQAYHNLGNSLFNNQKLKESLEAYKQALRYRPDDLETKHNLSYAKQILKQQQQQKKQEQQEGEESEEEQENQEEQQQEGEPQEGDQEKRDQKPQEQNQEQRDEVNNESESESTKEKRDLDKEDARKLLEIAENEEKKVQEKMRKVSGGKKRKKDW